MRFLLLSLLLFGPPARAQWSSSDFSLSTVPWVGYHLALSDFGSTAESPLGGLGLSQGPQAGVRLKAMLGRFFIGPDFGLTPLIGVGGLPISWSLGFLAGTRLWYSGFEVYAGLSHRDFFSYSATGGTFLRGGAAFPLEKKSFQVFFEFFSGVFTRIAEGYTAECPYYGIEGGLQFPLDFEPPQEVLR